jgi:pimeloyl-ACP methyl ester carboxylesterase
MFSAPISRPPVSPGPHPRQDARALKDRRVTVDGMNTQYLEAGTGPVLLLVHGHEQNAASWRWIMHDLARTHRVIAVSLPGHGETDPAVDGYAPGRDLAPFVADFLDTLGIGSFDLVGHSAGGSIALHVALADPARVRTLTLVASSGLGRGVNPLIALDTLPGLGELAILLSRGPGGNLQRTLLAAAMLFTQPWRVPADFLTEQHALGLTPGRLESSTAMARALFDVHGQREVLLDQLHTLTMPSLVVWGAWDLVLPVHQAKAAVDRLPRGRLAVFPDCGHLPHLEQPDRFVAEVRRLLDEQPAPHHHAA